MPFSEDEDGDIVADDEEREMRARGRRDEADSDDEEGEDLFNDNNLRAYVYRPFRPYPDIFNPCKR